MTDGEGTWVVTGADGITERESPPSGSVGDEAHTRSRPRELRPIEGPSAFGGSARRFWSLLWLISVQQYRLQYRTSVLGYVWSVLRPLALFAVLYFVFSQILRFGGEIENYALMILLGIMLFQFFTDGTGTAMGAMVRGESIVRKMHFPRIIIPLSVVVSSGMTALMNLGVALAFILAFGGEVRTTWLLIPVAFITLAIFTTGVALLLCTLFVHLRDIGQIWTVFVRALFYSSPILYPLELVPERFHSFVALNPLAPILTEARIWVLHPDAPGVIETVGVPAFLGSVAIAVGVCVLGLWLFVRQAPKVGELL